MKSAHSASLERKTPHTLSCSKEENVEACGKKMVQECITLPIHAHDMQSTTSFKLRLRFLVWVQLTHSPQFRKHDH